MSRMFVTIGLPGCGKSTWAQNKNARVISSDAIRKEMFGDEAIQGNPREVFAEVYKRLAQALIDDVDVIFDATKLNHKRAKAIKMCYEMNCECVAVYFDVDAQTCIERQNMRSRKVPASVIRRMSHQLVTPYLGEGWTRIERIL